MDDRASSLTADEEVDKCGIRPDPLTGGMSFLQLQLAGVAAYKVEWKRIVHSQVTVNWIVGRTCREETQWKKAN